MLISQKSNRKYHGMLNSIRDSVSPYESSKSFRVTIKQLDPNFPRNEDGSKKSMKDMTEEELAKHTSFVKTMCIRQGIMSDFFSPADIETAKKVVFKPYISTLYEDKEDYVIADVVCSNCGCSTKRRLTKERYEELKEISSGKRKEIMNPLSDSFICTNCLRRKIEEVDDGRHN